MNRILVTTIAFLASASALAQDSALDVVRGFVDAYNAHDSEKMLAFVNDDVRWMSVSDGSVTVESEGKKELARSMQSYFEGMPTTHATLHAERSTGDFVSVIEEVQWERDGEKQSQCAVSIYELDEKLISNVWYFAAGSCDGIARE